MLSPSILLLVLFFILLIFLALLLIIQRFSTISAMLPIEVLAVGQHDPEGVPLVVGILLPIIPTGVPVYDNLDNPTPVDGSGTVQAVHICVRCDCGHSGPESFDTYH